MANPSGHPTEPFRPDATVAQIAAQPPEMPSLPTERGGYARGAVHQYVSGLINRIRSLERVAAHDAGRVAGEVVHLAGSPQGQKAIAELLQLAADEVTGQQVAAAEQAARLISQAEQEAAKIIGAAKEQGDTVLNQARSEAKQRLDSASAQAAAVAEGAQQRLAALTQLHGETLARVQQMHDVTGRLLDGEQQRGSLEDEVQRALTPGSSEAPVPLDEGPAEP